MPYVTITASSGFTAEQKKELLLKTSEAVVDSIGAALPNVRVIWNEVAADDYLQAGQFGSKMLMFMVELIEGRTEELKNALIASLVRVGNQVTNLSIDDIRIRIHEMPKENMSVAGGISAKQAQK